MHCGPTAFLMLLLGIVGFVLGMTALVLSLMGRTAPFLASAAATLGVLAICVGPLGRRWGRDNADNAVSGPSLTESDRERIRALGYADACSCVTVGFETGAAPLLFGAGALLLALRARKSLG